MCTQGYVHAQEFCQTKNSGWQFFSFNTLTMSSHCLLASTVSHERSADNDIENPLYVMSHFSLATLKILSLSLSLN